ncbi:hypothetical protein TMatcc_009031 [Talaromyces marneffei ATCC 18224]
MGPNPSFLLLVPYYDSYKRLLKKKGLIAGTYQTNWGTAKSSSSRPPRYNFRKPYLSHSRDIARNESYSLNYYLTYRGRYMSCGSQLHNIYQRSPGQRGPRNGLRF